MSTKEEFEDLFDQYFDDVAAFLYSYASSKAQLKDWVQEVFIKMWETRDRIDFNHPGFKSYLFTAARNHALKELQEKRQYDEWLDQNLKRLTELQSREDSISTTSEMKEIYNTALSKVSSRARKTYLLSRESGLTYKEIAEVMNISIKTVEAHISKALRIIRLEFKNYSQK